MRIVRTIADLPLPKEGTTGFVPTMGAFHEGHLTLMRAAISQCDTSVVSLFVNPLQFGPNEDLDKYPRRESDDFAMAEQIGVDIIFAPSAEEMYRDMRTRVEVAGLSDLWEGAARPGHFSGVATVVAKLFHIVRPQVAYFGWKDYQQCAVVRKMTVDLQFPVRLQFMETVREPDGLAMSSRNAYLTDQQRAIAPWLFRILNEIKNSLNSGDKNVQLCLAQGRSRLSEIGFDVDYLALVDGETLEPTEIAKSGTRLIAAAKLGSTRLIDNIDPTS